MAVNYFDQKSVAGIPAFQNAAGELLNLLTYGFISLDKNAAGETVFKTPDSRVQQLMYDRYALSLSPDGKTLSRSLNSIFGGPETYSITESSNGPILNSKIDNELGTGNFSTPLLNASDVKTSGADQVSYLSQFGKYAQGAEARKEYKDGGLLGDLQNLVKSMGPLAPIAIAFALPGAGAYLGSQLFAAELAAGTMTTAYATTIGSGILSTAVQTANGVPLETALKNSVVNAITQTGAQSAATDLKNYVGKYGANAIASVGGSIVSTLIKGGNASDALNNATTALIASTVSEVTDPVTGRLVAVTRTTKDPQKIVEALAGELGKISAADAQKSSELSAYEKQVISAFEKSDTAQSLSATIEQANLTPEEKAFLKDAQQRAFASSAVAQALPSSDASATFTKNFSPFAANDPRFASALSKNPDLLQKFSEYTNTYGFNTPELNVVYTNLIQDALTKDPTYQPLLDEYKRITGNDYKLPEMPPVEIVAPRTPEPVPVPEPVPSPEPIIVSPPPTTPEPPAPPTPPTPPTPPITAPPPSPPPDKEPFVTELPPVDVVAPRPKTDEPIVVSPEPTKTPTKEPVSQEPITKPPATETPPTSTKTPEKEVPPFIYSTVTSPTTLSRNLSTDLPFYPSSAVTTGLTSARGAGEIEGQETGGKRRNVWNEASLRLKDALGL